MNIKKLLRVKKRNPKKINNSKGDKMRKHSDMTIKVGRIGSPTIEVVLNGDHTVQDALDAAGLNPKSSEEIRVNKRVVDTDYELKENDLVVLAKNIEGGL